MFDEHAVGLQREEVLFPASCLARDQLERTIGSLVLIALVLLDLDLIDHGLRLIRGEVQSDRLGLGQDC